MKRFNFLLVLFIIVGSVSFFTNCGPEDDPGNDDPNDQNQVKPGELILDENQVTPGQMVIVKTAVDLTLTTYEGTLGDSTISLSVTENDKELLFIVPTIASGKYTLSIEDLNAKTELMVKNYDKITNPNVVIDDYQKNIDNSIQELSDLKNKGWGIDPANMKQLENMKAAYTEILNGLTAEEKTSLAYFIKSNGYDNFSLPNISLVDSYYRSDPTNELWDVSKKFAGMMVLTIGTGKVFLRLTSIPSPDLLTKGTATAVGFVLVAEMVYLMVLAEKIGDLTGIADKISSELKEIFIVQDSKLELYNEESMFVRTDVTYRTLKKGDESHSSSFISSVASDFIEFKQFWINIDNQLEKIKSWFTGEPADLKDVGDILPVNPTTRSYAADPALLKVSNVQPSSVTLDAVVENGKLKLTAKADKETSFTFDLTYKPKDQDYTLSNSYDAIVKVKDPNTSVTDIDGNVYNVVKIGNNFWMAENLKTTRYSNGETIDNITDSIQWTKTSSGAWCYYDDDAANNNKYGKLYNWYAVEDSRNVCPTGWHVPTNTEWKYIHNQNLYGELKSTGTIKDGDGLWKSPNYKAANKFGFNAHPGGWRSGVLNPNTVKFNYKGNTGYWWSSTEQSSTAADLFQLIYYSAGGGVIAANKQFGVSVRCVKDN